MEKPNQSHSEKSVEISPTGNRAIIVFNNLDLNVQNRTSPESLLTIEKYPIHLVAGKSYGNYAVRIDDEETPAMKDLASQAEALRSIPEQTRPRAVMELFTSQIHYAYNDVVAKLAETNPVLAEWVAKNTGLNSSGRQNILLSELIGKKYGICRHLAVGYLWLAQKAGLEGIIMTSNHDVLKNITRSDDGEKLFKSADVGQSVVAHAWTEIKLSDGRWMPVDPTTQLVGDTEEKLRMFKEANYYGSIGDTLYSDSETKGLSPIGLRLGFKPGERTTQVGFSLELMSTKPIIGIGRPSMPPTNKPYRGEGRLTISTNETAGKLNLKIVEAK